MTIYNKPDEHVFASSARRGEVSDFPDIDRGWGIAFDQTGGIPPMEWFNFLFKRLDEKHAYLMQRGLPEWSATQEYIKGSRIQFDGVSYLALINSRNNRPSEHNSRYWVRWGFELGEISESIGFDALYNLLVGVPIPYPLSTVPTGCLAMNGQRFDKSRYPKLALKYPSGTLPDMRSEFIRGLDNGRGVDVGRVILTGQEDEFKFHDHGLMTGSGGGDSVIKLGLINDTVALNSGVFSDTFSSSNEFIKDGVPVKTFHSGGKETRPRNIAYHYICLAA